MKNEFPFRRGGFSDEAPPPSEPDGKNFTQVPEVFTRGLTAAQWQALQETYRAAWEKARREIDPDETFDGAGNYQI